MKQVILIHGLPSKEGYYHSEWPSESNAHWFPWIQREILRKGTLCQALEMPHPYDPNYQEHAEVLDQMKISEETILVGHSCGGGFLLRYFSEHPELKPKKIVLVAPWLDLEGYLNEINPDTTYFDFELDTQLAVRTQIELMYSTDDDGDILSTVKKVKDDFPGMIREHVFTNKGHFTEPDLHSKEFPELVEIILQ
jgi:predicted alpha/beta hydrolase family esterase